MSKKAANQHETPSDSSTLLRLQRDLADRERQLRDLTEQSLGFLEELAEARRLNADRERLAERIGELERVVADARRRLQQAGGSAPRPARGERAALAVVFWGEGSLAAASACAGAHTDLPVAWVGTPASVPAAFESGALTTIVHRDAHTPSQCWNLGLAGTDADAVLFVGPGAALDGTPALPADLPANTALLAPLVRRGDEATMGAAEADPLLLLAPRPAPSPPGETPPPVPFVDVASFAVRRAAQERLGAFDEALIGGASLIDWTLRARRANFDVLGAPAIVVTVAEAAGTAADGDDRERLFALAMHRPEQLGAALAGLPGLWEMSAGDLADFLAAVLARVPAGDLTAQRSVLEQIAVGVVRNALPSAQVCAIVQSSRIALLRSSIDAGLVNAEELGAALHRAENQRVSPPATAFEALARDIGLVRSAATATVRTLEATRAERREIDQQRHAQAARAERAEGARAAAAEQIEQAKAALRESDERRVAAEREVAEVRQQFAQLQQELAAAQTRAQQAEDRLAAQLQSHRELEREFLDAEHSLRSLHDHVAELGRIVGLANDTDRTTLQRRLADLQKASEQFATTLAIAGAADERALLSNLDRLAAQLANTERTLAEREHWIALLLREVTTRRLFPRALTEHEQAFLARAGRKT